MLSIILPLSEVDPHLVFSIVGKDSTVLYTKIERETTPFSIECVDGGVQSTGINLQTIPLFHDAPLRTCCGDDVTFVKLINSEKYIQPFNRTIVALNNTTKVSLQFNTYGDAITTLSSLKEQNHE